MKKLMFLITGKNKSKQQLKKELSDAFGNYQKTEKDVSDSLEEADDGKVTGFILPVGGVEKDSNKKEK